MPPKNPTQYYSEKTVTPIIELYMQGHTIAEIGTKKEFPPSKTIYNWMVRYADFSKRMKEARSLRAIYFEEKALAAAEETQGTSSEEVAAQRLKVDTYKWAAQVNNPAMYGNKTTVSGDKDNPVQFIISTGFPEPTAGQLPPKIGSDGLIEKVIPQAVGLLAAGLNQD